MMIDKPKKCGVEGCEHTGWQYEQHMFCDKHAAAFGFCSMCGGRFTDDYNVEALAMSYMCMECWSKECTAYDWNE
jgi:hypothetical protein